MNEDINIKVGITGEDSVNKLNKSLEATNNTVKDGVKSFSSYVREVRAAKIEMTNSVQGSEQYNKALSKAIKLQSEWKETNDKVKAGVRDLGSVTRLVAGTINGLAGGFQVAQGAMALFGVENDAVLKTMMQIQAVMSITQGIAGFANGFDNLQDLMVGFKNKAGDAKDAVTELSKVSGEASSSMSNLAKEGAVIGSNLAGTVGIVGGVNNELENLATSVGDVGKQFGKSYGDITVILDRFNKSQIDSDIALLKSGKAFKSLTFASNKHLESLGGIIDKKEMLKALEERSGVLGQNIEADRSC